MKRSHNRERRKNLPAFNGECLRAEEVGWPFEEVENLTSQPSMFLGTQASKRIWPTKVCALKLGFGQIGRSFLSSGEEPESLLF